jgi:hypothetical protein
MPRSPHPVEELFALCRRFGAAEAGRKALLLETVTSLTSLSAKRIRLLHDTLYFMRAYPDNAHVLGAVVNAIAGLRSLVDTYTGGDAHHHAFANTGIPGSSNTYEFSYAVLLRLVELFPGALEVDWNEVTDKSVLGNALILTLAAGEVRGLEDEYVSFREWLRDCKSHEAETDLETVLRMFRKSTLDPRQQEHAFETCALPIVYDLIAPGSGRCEVGLMPETVFYQKQPIARERFPLRPKIIRPLSGQTLLERRVGRRMIDMALAALCSRNLEIHPLIYANPADVTVIDCNRGVQVVLVGVVPEFRPALESNLYFMILKNGVPIAYGPACIFDGCCEMGINLFPEFRGGEIRYIYAQFMRALYHAAHVRYFFLVSYGMGEGNPEALKSGAFWFYRKLGFRATEPDVEALARKEEAIMRRRPAYRSSLATLRELSYTNAYFDLSDGSCKPLDFGSVGRAVSRFMTDRFKGDRRRAERVTARELTDALGISDYAGWAPAERVALQRLAPLLSLTDALTSWPNADKPKLARLLRAKGARSELDYISHVAWLPRFAKAIGELSSVDG